MDNIVPTKTINIEFFNTSSFFNFLSKPKRNNPSAIETEKTGIKTFEAVKTISVTPYCSVVKAYVYNGTKKTE